MSDILDRVVATLDNPRQRGDKWEARCPAHDDHKPSLGVWLGDNGAIIICCQAGCEKESILARLGLGWGDLFPEKANGSNGNRSQIVDRYPYVDEAGVLLFEVCRLDPKSFRQRVPDKTQPSGWTWRLGDTRRVIYRLPQVLAAAAAGETVLVVEGERDVHAAEALGMTATTCPGGAGKWRPEFTEALRGADVVVVADRDAPGRSHARTVAEAVGKVTTVHCAEPLTGKDLADHLAAGHTLEELDLVEDRWRAGPPEVEADEPLVHPSLQPVDLSPVLDGSTVQPMPDLLHRDDGAALLYPGTINSVHGDSGAGKGWVVCHTIVQNALRGRRTLILDFEDTAHSLTARLTALGMSSDQIVRSVVYVRPQVELGVGAVGHLCRLVVEHHVDLVVVDSLGEAFALEGVDENKDVEVGPWFRRVARPLADAGPAVLLVDHSTKASDNPLHPSGSKRKRAAVGGASYLVEAVQPFVKGEGGRLRLTCAKDRHGNYRRGAAVADLVMTSTGDEVRLTLYAPAEQDAVEVGVELAVRAAVAAVKAEQQPLSRNALEGVMAIKCRAQLKRAGIDLAVSRGLLDEENGARGSRLYSVPTASETTP